MSPKIVDEIDEGIIVTVDNGIAAHEAISKAKKKGLIVLVIDHHMPKVIGGKIVVPEADLIVDPSVEDKYTAIPNSMPNASTFHEYCGAGLVYRISRYMPIGDDVRKKISALAAIATIADVVELKGDNRKIYHEGIQNIQNRNVITGLQAILDLLKSDNMITEGDIGFRIAPMLNAPGRLYDDGASISLETVLSDNPEDAAAAAINISNINEIRKEKKARAVESAYSIIEKNNLSHNNPIVVYDPSIPEGVIGLVAGAIVEDFNSSAIVFTEKDGFLKGSARACTRDNMKLSLDKLNNLDSSIFIGYGGHPGAAGLSIRKDKLNELSDKLQTIMSPWEPPKDYIDIDLNIQASDIGKYTEEVRKYAPFGNGNPDIIFRINDFHLLPKDNKFYSEMKGSSVKFLGYGCEAIGFGLMDLYTKLGYPKVVDMVGKLSYHYFGGNKIPQVEIIDMKVSNAVPEKTDFYKMLEGAMRNLNLY